MLSYSVLIVALCAFSSAHGWGDKDDHPGMRKVQAACQKNVPVPANIYARAEKGDFQQDDESLKSYITCILETAKVMDANGNVEMTKFINGMIPEAKLYFGPKFLACQTAQNAIIHPDKNTKSLRLYECFRDSAGEKWYFL